MARFVLCGAQADDVVRTFAPAKINWTLEVLGRRPDGFHEIRSLMQTIRVCDTLVFEPADALTLEVKGRHAASEEDLVLKAARTLAEAVGSKAGARIKLQKRIPVGRGLGGGSSDAAATLHGLNSLYQLGLSQQELAEIGAGVGSDVPFFIYGGTALVEGRGERVTALPEISETWLVMLSPPMTLPEKTRRMYEALREGDFSDGSQTAALVKAVGTGQQVRDGDLCNAFNRAAYEMFPELGGYRDRLLNAGAAVVHLAGSGPTLFALAAGEREATEMAERIGAVDARVMVSWRLGAGKATVVQERASG